MVHPLNGPFDGSRNDEFLADFRDDPGPVADAFPMPQASLAACGEKLPETIVRLWREDGLGSLYKRALWMCDPVEFAPVAQAVFAADPQLRPDETHIYAYSAFGILVFWNETFNSGEVDLLTGIVKCYGLFREKRRNVFLQSISALETFGTDNRALDLEDEAGKWLYSRARKALGDLAYGECYGFFPALSLGGPCLLENLKKVRAVEHFAFLAQTQDFVLRNYLSRPIQDVRPIGGG